MRLSAGELARAYGVTVRNAANGVRAQASGLRWSWLWQHKLPKDGERLTEEVAPAGWWEDCRVPEQNEAARVMLPFALCGGGGVLRSGGWMAEAGIADLLTADKREAEG